ncbi:putative ANTH domain protein [Trichinella spiralis]|uniref:putative ANTH domain protein n=1 Tax=Trichinella spiralis TaxID=6334 RepID=UPI0001EFCCA1|nr:putative ANTH domain protein [Trichinella spiralis]
MTAANIPKNLLRRPSTMMMDREEYEKLQSAALLKCINAQECAVKEKHLRTLILGTYNDRGAGLFWANLTKIQLESSHRFLEICEQVGHLKEGGGMLIKHYCAVLVKKLIFHQHNQQIPGNVSLTESQLEALGSEGVDNWFELSVEVMDYLDAILQLQQSGLPEKELVGHSDRFIPIFGKGRLKLITASRPVFQQVKKRKNRIINTLRHELDDTKATVFRINQEYALMNQQSRAQMLELEESVAHSKEMLNQMLEENERYRLKNEQLENEKNQLIDEQRENTQMTFCKLLSDAMNDTLKEIESPAFEQQVTCSAESAVLTNLFNLCYSFSTFFRLGQAALRILSTSSSSNVEREGGKNCLLHLQTISDCVESLKLAVKSAGEMFSNIDAEELAELYEKEMKIMEEAIQEAASKIQVRALCKL